MAISRKRAFAWAPMLMLAALVVPPLIQLTRYRLRIPGILGGALGRPVTVAAVSLRLLPQPGFDLKGLVIGEDPSFGAEPVLTAPEVTATLRLTSLWRGRLEIGSLRLKDASFNLVRRPDGAWNIESLMMQAAKTPAAPTAKSRPESRPRFPYIEVNSGRLNFKSGVEKKLVALTDADFALWLASENEWRARLEARAMRTDANLSDTGTIEAEARVRRNAQANEPLVTIQARLRDAQLGNLSALIYGRDRGWRGGTTAEITISGTRTALNFGIHAAIDDFHRYDITPAEPLRLDAVCAGALNVTAETISNLNCTTPASRGVLAVSGSIGQLLHQRQYDLRISLKQFPVQRAMALARRSKRDLPDDLAATGALNAELSVRSQGDRRVWTGAGNLRDLALRSGAESALAIGDVAFNVGAGDAMTNVQPSPSS